VVLLVCLALVGQKSPAENSGSSEILWDSWGVPHIFARNENGAFRAFGWAEMHNHANTLLRLYAQARGRAAEYFGREYLASDRIVRTMGIPSIARRWYAQQPEDFRSDLDAFAGGINSFAAEHPEALEPLVTQVLPVEGVDVLAHTIRILWGFEASVSRCPSSTPADGKAGSNGWAIAPARSAAGHALLLANPHLPWVSDSLFFEAQISVGGRQEYGATLVGFPVLAIAFNDFLGWTHTINTIEPCSTYVFTPAGSGYLYDGQEREFQTATETIQIRQPDGGMAAEPLTIRHSVQGPVIADSGRLLAIRVAGLQSGTYAGILNQWWNMGRARDLESFETALRTMQLPMFNTIYADREGNIGLFYCGLAPKHKAGDFELWAKPVPGSSSSNLWTSTLGFDALPRMVNPAAGWVQNSNSAPWYMTMPPLDPARFPPYLAPLPDGPHGWPSLREQRGMQMLIKTRKFSLEGLADSKYSTHSELADRDVADLITAAQRNGSELDTRAADVLQAWDRNMDSGSRGAVLFYAWARRMAAKGLDARVPFDPADPLDTPRGIANSAVAAEMLERAAQDVQSEYGKLDVAWGDVFRLRWGPIDLPGNGASGALGVFRVIEYAPDRDKRFRSVGGDSYIAAVEFSNPVKAKVLTTYGNSSDPASPHFGDQLTLARDKQLRAAWLTRQDIESHLVERTILTDAALVRQSQRKKQ
jgi:acyl-homoserine-lactone acylase